MSRQYGSIPAAERQDQLQHDDTTVEERSRSPLIALLVASLGLVAVAAAVGNNYGYADTATSTSAAISFNSMLGHSKDKKMHDGHHHKKHTKPSFLLDEALDETELFYHDQFVDHIHTDTEHTPTKKLATYSHRYYKKSKHFKGPGSPILMILGGEDILDLPMLYPFVNKGLAEKFGAFVVSPEHRFYGKSMPIKDPDVQDFNKYLTPDQALLDSVNLVQYVREEVGCSTDRTSPLYCPVITFGGSYPGFLSTMMRFRFPDHIDIGYASSAPLELYSQVVDSNAYYEKVSEVAELASPGCVDAVRSTMFATRDALLANDESMDVKDAAKAIGICHKSLPSYMRDVYEFVSEAVIYLVPAVFADFNMAYYPPGPDTALERACGVFQSEDIEDPLDKLAAFYDLRGEVEYGDDDQPKCFDLSLELPTGRHARIMGADWSGSGGGFTGEVWEFQCCKDLIIRGGYSDKSMFIPREFSYFWHKEHCHDRFPGVAVDPFRMVNEWHFDDLSKASRILFTNGLHDGWSTSSILQTDNPQLRALNFPNGAHHSDLAPTWPNEENTDDIKQGFEDIADILGEWLDEIYAQRVN